MRYTLALLLLYIAFIITCGCDDNSGSTQGDGGTDSDSDGDTDSDSDTDNDSDTDSDSDTDTDSDSDTDADSDTDIENQWGFPMRIPQTRTLSCEDWEGKISDWETDDTDWLCTFSHNSVEGVIYVQNTPVECFQMMSQQATYETQTAQIWIDGNRSALKDVRYNWGGNHHNETLDFKYGDKKYRYSHSSYGWGWRDCQNMDCIQVLGINNKVVEDGCTCDRTLPIVCTQIGLDGKFDELVDTFEVCQGDSECG